MSFKFRECGSIEELMETLEDYMSECELEEAEDLSDEIAEDWAFPKFGFEDVRTGPGVEQLVDLTSEKRRVYHYKDGDLVIEDPVAIRISELGSHYVVMSDGTVAYIPPGWKYLTWEPRNGKPHISF